jgi:hypothetical protein
MSSYKAALCNTSLETMTPIGMRMLRAQHIEMITDIDFRTNSRLHERGRKYYYFIPYTYRRLYKE